MPKLTVTDLEPRNYDETIGKRIARFRKKQGLTQKELSEKIGIDRTLIANYEVDRVRIYDDMIARIAIALNISADVLLGVKEVIDKENTQSLKIMKRMRRIEKLPSMQQKTILRNIDLSLTGIEKELSD